MSDLRPLDIQPYVGARVLYQTDGRNGLRYHLPATVTVTRDSHPGDYPCASCGGSGEVPEGPVEVNDWITCPGCEGTGKGEHNPLPVPTTEWHVHLTVLTPGGIGVRLMTTGAIVEPSEDEDFVGAPALDVEQATGTYVEHNVPYDPEGSPRSWRWIMVQTQEWSHKHEGQQA